MKLHNELSYTSRDLYSYIFDLKNIIKHTTIILIAVIFMVSGITKALNMNYFSNIIHSYIPLLNPFSLHIITAFICFIEIIIGFELFLSYKLKRNIYLVLILIISFTIIYTYGLFFLHTRECGCFGGLLFKNLETPIIFYIKNILIFAGSFFIIKYETFFSTKDDKEEYAISNIVKLFTISLAFFMGLMINAKPHENLLINHEEYHKEILFKQLSLSNDSNYFIFVFSYSCPHCLNSIENVKTYQSCNYIDKVIFVTYKTDTNTKNNFIHFFHIKNDIIEFTRKQIYRLTPRYPTGFYITHDKIKKIITGEMPANILLKNILLN